MDNNQDERTDVPQAAYSDEQIQKEEAVNDDEQIVAEERTDPEKIYSEETPDADKQVDLKEKTEPGDLSPAERSNPDESSASQENDSRDDESSGQQQIAGQEHDREQKADSQGLDDGKDSDQKTTTDKAGGETVEGGLVESISDPVSTVLTAFDGRELPVRSLATQTGWSWIEDMKAREISDEQSVKSEPGNDVDDVLKKASEKERSSASKKKSSRSSRSSIRSGRSSTSRMSAARAARSRSTLIPAYPEPRIDDEFGILLVDDEDSDLSDTNVKSDFLGDQRSLQPVDGGTDENYIDAHEAAGNEGILPSVGPPQILQYLRESEIPMEEAFPDRTEEDLEKVSMQAGDTCDFCGRQIQKLPTKEEQMSKNPQELYCCSEFRKLLQFALQYQSQLLEQQQQEAGLIDVGPHASFGSRKKSAQELQRLREEAEKRRKLAQLERQRRAAEAAQATAQARKREHATVELDVGRQMRTINYSLSSMRCLEEGWTLRAPSPLAEPASDWQLYDFDLDEVSDLAAGLGSTPRGTQVAFLEKFYPNGRKFLTLFQDRTGNVFYPSGNLAILISKLSDRPGHLGYVLHDDQPLGRTRILGVFDNVGKGTCYCRDGRIKINYDPVHGLDFDSRGARRRQWRWAAGQQQQQQQQPPQQQPHVHAPPFQPIVLSVNKIVGLRLMSRDSIFLSFITNSRSCKINVGSRFRMQLPESAPPANQLSPLDLYLSEASTKIAGILEKVSFLSTHPNHPRPDKLPNSLHLESRRQRNLAARAKLGMGKAS